ncbi:MAG: carboxypeptidase-like regulatory domain-containing protein [Vicinamibacterales bacterium]
MRQTCVSVLLALGVVVTAAVPAAQQTARDTPARPTVGTAVISGTVTSDDPSNRPIRHALVTLTPSEIFNSRTTATDDQGRFGFSRLPAGHYTLSASKPGYAQSYYGAKVSWQGPSSPITVEDGQQLTAALRIMHGAVIAGTVLDSFGRPQVGVRVVVLRFRMVGGERQATIAFGGGQLTTSTDDRGAYRIYGLSPGEYAIGASVTSSVGGPEIRLATPAEIQWAQQQLQRAGQPVAGMTTTAAAPPPGPAMGYAPVYYPGTADPAGAATITLGPSEERTGIDFPLQWVPTARIEGTIVDQDGRPATAVQLNLVAKQSIPLLFPFGGTSRTDSRGGFTFPGVTPGDYTIVARSIGRAGGPGDPSGRAAGPAPPRPTEWAQQTLSVAGSDVKGISLRLQPGLAVSGRMAFEGATPPPTDLSRVRIGLGPGPGPGTTVIVGSSSAQVNADSTFSLAGATPGRYRVNASVPGNLPATPGDSGLPRPIWSLKSVVANGVETLDSAFEVGTSDVSGVVVTFTDHPTELSGTLLDPHGKPAPGYWVVTFTTDRTLWISGSRRVRTTRPDALGKFRIVGLPAGEYYMVTLTDLDQADLSDPAFLEQLAAASFKITLADGEKKTQDLKLSGGSPD